MSREYASIAPGRAHAPGRREPAPAHGPASRAAARDTAQPAGARTGAGTVSAKVLFSLAAVPLLAIALLLWAGAIHAGALGSGTGHSSGGRRAISPATRTIDPRLILVPRTVTQAATVAGVRAELTTAPLLPGSNRFELRLAARGQPLVGAGVVLVARMSEMAMRPITLPMSQVRPGRYAAMGPLTMFGRWQLTVQIARPGAAPIRHQFTVGVDLPRDLLAAPATRSGPQR